jgi:branched-chain amino acid transport system permease protein
MAGIGFSAVGGYIAGRLAIEGWSTVPAIVVAVGVSVVGGLALGLILGRLRSLYLAMATFAFVLLVRFAALHWDSQTGGALGLLGIPARVTTFGALGVAAVLALLLAFYERGRSGRMLEALRLDEVVAANVGVNVVGQRIIAFVLGSAIGAIAGALNSLMFSFVVPDSLSFSVIVNTLTVVVIGGLGAWWGTVLGAAVVVLLPDVFGFTDEWQLIVQGIAVVLIVMFAPEGLVGLIRSAITRGVRRQRKEPAAGTVAASPDEGPTESVSALWKTDAEGLQ